MGIDIKYSLISGTVVEIGTGFEVELLGIYTSQPTPSTITNMHTELYTLSIPPSTYAKVAETDSSDLSKHLKITHLVTGSGDPLFTGPVAFDRKVKEGRSTIELTVGTPRGKEILKDDKFEIDLADMGISFPPG
jgi:hypothetical protein